MRDVCKNNVLNLRKGYEQALEDTLDITNRQREILDILTSSKDITQEEIADQLQVSRYTVMRDLKSLKEKGLVFKDKTKEKGSWQIGKAH